MALFSYAHGLILQRKQMEDLKICLCQRNQSQMVGNASFLWIQQYIQEIAAFACPYHPKQGRLLHFSQVEGSNVKIWYGTVMGGLLSEKFLDTNLKIPFAGPPLNTPSLQKYKRAKIPDIEKCLDVVATLQVRKGTGTAPN